MVLVFIFLFFLTLPSADPVGFSRAAFIGGSMFLIRPIRANQNVGDVTQCVGHKQTVYKQWAQPL